MKFTGARADQFIRFLNPPVKYVLIYGPDAGLVRERAETIIKNFVGSVDDPFSNIEILATDLKSDPAIFKNLDLKYLLEEVRGLCE